jgi:hypothetical protein
VQAFSVNTPAFIGRTDSFLVLDLGAGYDLPWANGARISLNVSNLSDNRHQEMVGSARLGRWAVIKTHVSF